MKQRQASVVWNELRGLNYNASARFLEKGPLTGEHVVEIEPGPSLSTKDFNVILRIAKARSLELSYGLSPRRVMVLS